MKTPRAFRLAALLAILGMLLGWMEVAVPDVHDGHGDVEAEVGARLTHDHPPPSAPHPADHPAEAPHTCHCVHAHAPALPARTGEPPRASVTSPRFALGERAPDSVAREPHIRPPVA
jgi:hypothetical protein